MATVGLMGSGTFSEFMLATKSGKTPSFNAPGMWTQPSRRRGAVGREKR